MKIINPKHSIGFNDQETGSSRDRILCRRKVAIGYSDMKIDWQAIAEVFAESYLKQRCLRGEERQPKTEAK